MAVTTYFEHRQGPGPIWIRIVSLWDTYVGDATIVWTAATTTTGGFRAVKVTYTIGANSTEFYQVDLSCASTDVKGVREVIASSGWTAQPVIQPITQAGRTTKTDWNTNLVAIRRAMWTAWTGVTMGTNTLSTFTCTPMSTSIDLRYWTLQQGNIIGMDFMSCAVATQTANNYYAPNVPAEYGIPGQTLIVAGQAPGAPVDLAPLTTAVEDLSFIDYDMSINNGADMFSVRGKVRSE